MQLQLVKFHTFSQPSNQESELPSFDDAFDKDSLRKFFKDQDSQMGTPFTTYTEAPMYEDLQFAPNDKNIFGSPFTSYINLNLSSEIEDGPSSKVFQMLEDQIEEKSVKNPFKLHRVPVQQRLFEDNRMEILEDKSRINISFGDNEASVEKDNTKEISSLFNQFAEVSKKAKKPVFTILRNVMPKTIAKVEKETKKAPILEKVKKALKEKKEEKKKQEKKEEKAEEKEEKTSKKGKRKAEKN